MRKAERSKPTLLPKSRRRAAGRAVACDNRIILSCCFAKFNVVAYAALSIQLVFTPFTNAISIVRRVDRARLIAFSTHPNLLPGRVLCECHSGALRWRVLEDRTKRA